jgi:hypothetical protein
VFHGWAKVPAINSMGHPGFVPMGLFADEHADARWCHGGGIEVKCAVNLDMCQKNWVDARSAQQVYRKDAKYRFAQEEGAKVLT